MSPRRTPASTPTCSTPRPAASATRRRTIREIIGTYISTLTGAGNATSTNSGTVLQDITTSAQDGGNALTNNSGSTFAITTSTVPGSALVSGSATTNNSGTVGGSVTTTADGGGNATTNNSGVIGGLLSTQTSNGGSGSGGGNATSINSGTVNSIANVTADGGNATVTNSGNVLFNGCCGPPFGIFNGTALGGDATTINYGNVNGGVFTTTGLGGGDGNATLINYGTIRGDVLTLPAIQAARATQHSSTTARFIPISWALELALITGRSPVTMEAGFLVKSMWRMAAVAARSCSATQV